LAIIGMFAADALHERAVATVVARRAAENLAESLAQQASDTFEAVDGALLALSERVETDGTGPAARDRLRDSMAALVTTMPRLHGLLIVDERGRLVVSNGSSATRPDLRFGDRPYFRFHQTHAGLSVHISGPARSETENVTVLFVTRRLNHVDGRFAGVAVAQIAFDYFEQIYGSVDVGRSGSIDLIADDGTLMVRKPRALIGHKIRNAWLFADAYKYDLAGSYIRPSIVDGVLRLFAFRRLDRYPLVLIVALAESEYLAEWRSDARANLVALALVIAMIGGLASGLGAQIDRRKRAEDALARLAMLDGLTGLANRRQFDFALEREWRRAARDQTPLALLMIDVDNFKAYNDCYGHQQGDAALISVARAIAASAVRPSDTAARYGGEEFAVILPVTTGSNAVIVAERVRRAIVELGVPHAAGTSPVASVSIGVASIVPTHLSDRSTLVEAADAELYKAKRTGRNRTSVMSDTSREIAPA